MGESKSKMSEPVIAVTMGDPSGIGPEIILKSFGKEKSFGRSFVVGDYSILEMASQLPGIKAPELHRIEAPGDCLFSDGVLNILDLKLIKEGDLLKGISNAVSGDAAFQYVKKAIQLVRSREADAIVTAPLNKEALHMAGHYYPGHTEILASLSGTTDYAMLLYDRKLSVIHVSTHIPILQAITRLNQSRIEKVIELADISMRKLTGKPPRIAVAGVNPHAGEKGLFGTEEIKIIAPAVSAMNSRGINVEGPFPPDTVYLQAVNGKYDIVVAMYHDQGHIPLKLLGFSSGVNITVGLPFVRTSVDHGTAFEIAWKGIADEGSMTEAMKLAIKLSR
jgi:4-phospho-D-threonate 3-dehydrogenase / 4-phospho-D-erythronate 3-dehydrogenase